MAIRKRNLKNGKVSWQIDYYDPSGRRVMKCFRLKAQAQAYLAKVVASIKEARYEAIFDRKQECYTTFSELADRYEENYRGQKCFSRLKYYLLDIYRQAFGPKRLSDITYLDLQSFRNQRKATPLRSGKPRKDATVNREMSTLRHMFNKAVQWGMLDRSPFERGERLMFKENNCRLKYLAEAEVVALLKACDDLKETCPHLRPIVETALLTGMRRGELLSLKWEQIRNGFIYLTETKSGKPRQIPINDRLGQLFKELRLNNQLKSPYVFCDSEGKRYYDVRRSFASACRRAGIEAFRFHDLRHTFASQLVMRGASLKSVQELLGHASLAMTMRYAHLSQEHLRDSINLLNDIPIGKFLVNFDHKCQSSRNPSVCVSQAIL